jgi:hypothetical protein
MKWHLVFLSACVLILATLSTASGAIIAFSNFNTNAEGWTTFGDGSTVLWNSTGGNPGGHISATDNLQGDTWFFVAPAKFLGNASAAYGEFLSFDLRQSVTTSQYNDRDVILIGGGIALFYDTPVNPASLTFTSYSIPLVAAAGWRSGSFSGPAATEAEMETALGGLTALRIRGEYSGGLDVGYLDNVVLGGNPTVPEPTSFMMFGAGAACLLGYGWRRLSCS